MTKQILYSCNICGTKRIVDSVGGWEKLEKKGWRCRGRWHICKTCLDKERQCMGCGKKYVGVAITTLCEKCLTEYNKAKRQELECEDDGREQVYV